MNAKEVITYAIDLDNNERVEIFKSIEAVDKGEGGIDDFPTLKKFHSILRDLGENK